MSVWRTITNDVYQTVRMNYLILPLLLSRIRIFANNKQGRCWTPIWPVWIVAHFENERHHQIELSIELSGYQWTIAIVWFICWNRISLCVKHYYGRVQFKILIWREIINHESMIHSLIMYYDVVVAACRFSNWWRYS